MNVKKEEVPEQTFNEVFLTRSKIGKYFNIPDEKREILLQYFQKNPYPKKEELLSLSQITKIEKNKIQNWFKYQRQKDFKTNKLIIKTYKCNRKFSREGKKILEMYFRKNRELTENALKKLSDLLQCDKSQIERWFYYRNKKLSSLITKSDNPKQTQQPNEISQENLNSSSHLDEKPTTKTEETFKELETTNPQTKNESFNSSIPFLLPALPIPPPLATAYLLMAHNLTLLNKFPNPLSPMPNLSFLRRNDFFQNNISNPTQISPINKEQASFPKKEENA